MSKSGQERKIFSTQEGYKLFRYQNALIGILAGRDVTSLHFWGCRRLRDFLFVTFFLVTVLPQWPFVQ